MKYVILNMKKYIGAEKGFSIIEVLISIAIFSIILLTVISFFFSVTNSNSKSKAQREAQDNAKRVLEIMTYEIRKSKSIYTPTSTSSQLSLETTNYLPVDETTTFIDFFVCGLAVCMKKESQNLIALTPDNLEVTSLTFTQLKNANAPSVRINLVLNYANPNNDVNSSSIIDLTSTASLRNY